MPEPFTLRILVPGGDSEGLRIIDRLNWTGKGLVFPRSKWSEIKSRREFRKLGVYILSGYAAQEDVNYEDIPTVYIGQADGIGQRIDEHAKKKDFWDKAIVFVASNDGLNRAHITWLEYALIRRALDIGRCHLDNGNTPQEPPLSETDKADTEVFLHEILRILPLVGMLAFEQPDVVARAVQGTSATSPSQNSSEKDTIIVPATPKQFEKIFLGEDCWYSIRISRSMIDKIKFIAGYQSQPISAITHIAPVERIELYTEDGKYRVVFSEKASEIGPFNFKDAPPSLGSIQGIRYSSYAKILQAKNLGDCFDVQD